MKLIIMLEKDDTRYEFYLVPIKRSNVDDTIVEYKYRVCICKCMTTGAIYHGNYRYDDILSEINLLVSRGYKPVTNETKSFA